jgi:hypothetical protein
MANTTAEKHEQKKNRESSIAAAIVVRLSTQRKHVINYTWSLTYQNERGTGKTRQMYGTIGRKKYTI